MSVSFAKFENKYILNGTLTTKTSLHIGSRTSFDIDLSDSPIIKDKNGIPFIPGSSFKGVFRATTDSILRSFQENNNLGKTLCCDGAIYLGKVKDSNAYCVSEETKNNMLPEDWEDYVNNGMEKDLCLSCKLFGSPVIASRINFQDAYITNFSSKNVFIRDGIKIRRDTETTQDKAKFDLEALGPGASFGFNMTVENVNNAEMGLIIRVLEMFNEGYALLGGKKTAGMGRVQIDYEIRKIDIDTLLEGKESEVIEKSVFLKNLKSGLLEWGKH